MFTVATTERFESRASYVISADGKVWLLTAYTKTALDNLSAAVLVKLRKELIHD